jgi:acyl-CoA synthetase (AMP-forming)/AMP-acid ligase II
LTLRWEPLGLTRSQWWIIRGGENIARAEIEDVLVEHPGIREVALVGADDPEWGQLIVAVVVPAGATTPDPGELRDLYEPICVVRALRTVSSSERAC